MRWAWLVVAMLGPCAVSEVRAADLGATVTQLAGTIEQVAGLKGKKIGVGNFPLAGGRMSELGSFLADQFDVALTGRSSAGGFEIVSRGQLCQVIRENKLWVDDRFDPSLHKKLGRLSQADVMLAGQVTPLAREVAVSVRLLDTETGRSLWARSTTVPLDDSVRALLARAVIGDGCGAPTQASAPAVDSAGDPLKIEIVTDKPAYRIGETVTFKLRVNRDAYVTLVDIGTSGDVTVLYPNRLHSSHFVRGGQEVMIPPADAGFVLTAQGPPGFDQIRAIATDEPAKIHASDFGAQRAVFRSLDRIQTRDLAVTIKNEREKVTPTKWAEHTIAVEIRH